MRKIVLMCLLVLVVFTTFAQESIKFSHNGKYRAESYVNGFKPKHINVFDGDQLIKKINTSKLLEGEKMRNVSMFFSLDNKILYFYGNTPYQYNIITDKIDQLFVGKNVNLLRIIDGDIFCFKYKITNYGEKVTSLYDNVLHIDFDKHITYYKSNAFYRYVDGKLVSLKQNEVVFRNKEEKNWGLCNLNEVKSYK